MYLGKQMIENKDVYICSNPDSAFVFFWTSHHLNIWFGFLSEMDLLDSPSSSNFECDARWIASIFTSHYGGKLIPTLYKDKNSFNT